jgi:hypothetical protein
MKEIENDFYRQVLLPDQPAGDRGGRPSARRVRLDYRGPERRCGLSQVQGRIEELRDKGDFFEGQTSIYFIQLLEFDRFPRNQALMLNLKSTAGDPLMPFIGCSIPSDQSNACRIYDWKNNEPEIDGTNEKLFLEFRD